MATKIPLGTPAYLTAFQTGQGAGFSNYFDYAPDEDINFILLRTTINTLIDEISAVQGPNALAALDVILWDDAANPITPGQTYGVVGAASYEVSVNAGDLDIKKGVAFIGGTRVEMVADLLGVSSSGGAGTRWVALDFNGAPFIESAAGGQALDIASVTWNGTIFTGAVTHLADVFFDGDAWAEIRDRTAAGTSFPATTFRRGVTRLEEIEQSLSAATGGAAVIALPPGAVGTPGLIFSDGAGAADTTTGFFRQAANVWGFAVSAAEKLRFIAQGLAGIVGSVGAPTFTFIGRLTTGLYSPAANVAGLAGGGELSIEAGSLAAGGCGFPNLFRVRAFAGSAISLGSSTTPSVLNYDSEDYDVGGFHDTGTNTDQFVIPANGAGTYQVYFHVYFDESTSAGTPNSGDRGVRITRGGTELIGQRVQSTIAGDTKVAIAVDVDLTVGQILRGEADQDSGGAMDIFSSFSVHRVA